MPAIPPGDQRWQPSFAIAPSVTPGDPSHEIEHDFALMTGRLLLWERQQATLAAIAHRALVADDLDEVLAVAAELAAETMDVDLLEIREATDGGLVLRVGEGWSDGCVGVDCEVGDLYQAGYTFDRPQEVVVTDLMTETRFAPTDLLLAHGVRAGVGVVLPDGEGGRFGIIAAHARERRDFDADDTAFLASLAELLGDVIARDRATRALASREAALGALLERETAVVWRASPDGSTRTYVSPAYDQLWGRPRARLADRPADWLAAISVDDAPRVLAALEGLPFGAYDVTYRIHRPDGSSRLIHDRATLVLDDAGDLVEIVGMAEDVTDLLDQSRPASW